MFASGADGERRATQGLYRVKREILINGSQRETRVAIIEDDRLVELLLDRPDHRRMVGDIYLGRVEAVLPGIQAAFVDIGQEKSAFLHASDLLEPEEDEDPGEDDDEADELDAAEAEAEVEAEAEPAGGGERRSGRRNGDRRVRGRSREAGSGRRPIPNIGDILKKGQTLPVDDEATVPDLVRDLAALGVRVHAVEPGRVSLEERLLGILRAGHGDDQ